MIVNSERPGYQLWHRPLKMASLVYEREIGLARDSPAQTVYMVKSYPPSIGQVDSVPRSPGLPCVACKRFEAFSKERYAKLVLPG